MTLEDLNSFVNEEFVAELDCTSGWYTSQVWSGVRLDHLMDRRVFDEADARSIGVWSATGYVRRFPVRDLERLWLVTANGWGSPVTRSWLSRQARRSGSAGLLVGQVGGPHRDLPDPLVAATPLPGHLNYPVLVTVDHLGGGPTVTRTRIPDRHSSFPRPNVLVTGALWESSRLERKGVEMQLDSRRRLLWVVTTALLVVAVTATAALAGDGKNPMLTGRNGWTSESLFTVGDSVGTYTPVGVLDGLGAWDVGGGIVRVFSNHELAFNAGAFYTLANGTSLQGARVSSFDINVSTRTVVSAGLAYDTVYDRLGNVVTSPGQINERAVGVPGQSTGGIDRLCSSHGYSAGDYGLVDNIYFTSEESSTGFGSAHGGSFWALDVANGDLYALPDLGRGSFENLTALDTGNGSQVAFIMGDDSSLTGAPLYMYVGTKVPGGDFLQRNGLTGGQLYAWVPQGDPTTHETPQDFNGTGSSRGGKFVKIAARDLAQAGQPGYDAQGYLNDVTLQNSAYAKGAFQFSRPEDVATNPDDGTQVVLASTGNGGVFPADNWGDVYVIDVKFPGGSLGKRETIPADVTIVYDGDEPDKQDQGIRSPDNLDWAADGMIYINEDRATVPATLFGAISHREASIWGLDPDSSAITQVAEINRSVVYPTDATDTSPTDIGNWESSGVLDVSHLFDLGDGTVLLTDVQAHSVRNGSIGGSSSLVEGGQLLLLWE